MIRRTAFLAFATVLVAILLICRAHGQSSYTITDLGGVAPYAINSSGQITGTSGSAGLLRAFIWTPTVSNGTTGTMLILGLPRGFSYGQGRAINDRGQVVGWGGTSTSPAHAVLWSGGSVVDLGTIKGTGQSVAYAINAYGEVAGSAFAGNNGPYNTFLWKPTTPNGTSGRMVDLKLPGVATFSGPSPYGMDTYGRVACANFGFIWTPATANGTTGSSVSAPWGPGAINDTGQTTGVAPYTWTSSNGVTYDDQQPAFYDPILGLQVIGFPIDSVRPAGSYWAHGYCWAISNSGIVVGDASGSGYSTVWIWTSATGMHDLNVNPSISWSGWVLLQVTGVNTAGQVVGSGTFNGVSRGFLLTPQ